MRIQSNSDKWTHHQTLLSLTCTFLKSYNLASLFNYPWLVNISRDTLTANKHLLLPKCSEMMVWFYDKLGETLKTYRANSHLPLRCPPNLRASSQLIQVSNCPQPEFQDQTKHYQISQSEYFRGHQKHTFSEQAELPQPSRDMIG